MERSNDTGRLGSRPVPGCDSLLTGTCSETVPGVGPSDCVSALVGLALVGLLVGLIVGLIVEGLKVVGLSVITMNRTSRIFTKFVFLMLPSRLESTTISLNSSTKEKLLEPPSTNCLISSL